MEVCSTWKYEFIKITFTLDAVKLMIISIGKKRSCLIFYSGFDDKETCGKNKHPFSCFQTI